IIGLRNDIEPIECPVEIVEVGPAESLVSRFIVLAMLDEKVACFAKRFGREIRHRLMVKDLTNAQFSLPNSYRMGIENCALIRSLQLHAHCYSGRGTNSTSSPGTLLNRPCFQSRFARSMRSAELETKFHQI